MLYIEIFFATVFLTVFFYTMQDLRILTLIAALLAFTFVFIQSSLIVSFSIVVIVAIDYLVVSYVGVVWMGQTGNFGKDALIIMVFLPVSSFIGYMCSIVQKQHKELKQSQVKLKTTFSELETTHAILESFNQWMMESLHYAEMIQRSLLPGLDRMKTESPDSLIIWMPKDIVGGDIFYTYTHPEKTVIALMDCTGHGVPGAFLTMIVYTEIRKIILDQGCHDPAEILKRLNRSMKNVLHKNGDKQMVDDGLDAAVIEVSHNDQSIRFAGAHIPLFYIKNDVVTMIKGDKQSIGYFNSDENHTFTNHKVSFPDHGWIYLKTDGFTDQMGGEKRLRFGTNRFEKLIASTYKESFTVQRNEILKTLFAHQGANEQMDDITVIGFKV
jgi:serine phosphatase RsbU (regulator of sigma subunit)